MYLTIDPLHVRRIKSLQQVICAPLNQLLGMFQLAQSLELGFILDHTPAQERHRVRPREGELQVVARVVVSAGEVDWGCTVVVYQSTV